MHLAARNVNGQTDTVAVVESARNSKVNLRMRRIFGNIQHNTHFFVWRGEEFEDVILGRMISDEAREVAPGGKVQGAANWAKACHKYSSINNQPDATIAIY